MKSLLLQHVEEFSNSRKIRLMSETERKCIETVLAGLLGGLVSVAFWLGVFGLGFVN